MNNRNVLQIGVIALDASNIQII